MILISEKISSGLMKYLKKHFSEIILLPSDPGINKKVAYHTDLSCFYINNSLICSPFIFDFLKSSDLLKTAKISLIRGEKRPGRNYPDDIPYNAALIGKNLFCSCKFTEPIIIKTAKEAGFNIINVSQGYTKCSIVKVSERAIITSDKQIAQKAQENDIKVFMTENTGVLLDGYRNGFLGGASFLAGNKLYFTGNIKEHDDYEKIIQFCKNEKVFIDFYKDEKLYDYGSPVFI